MAILVALLPRRREEVLTVVLAGYYSTRVCALRVVNPVLYEFLDPTS